MSSSSQALQRAIAMTAVCGCLGAIAQVPDPIAYWHFDEGAGTVVHSQFNSPAADAVFRPAPQSPSWETSDLAPVPGNTAAMRTGISDGAIINVASSVRPSGSFSIAAWVNIYEFTANCQGADDIFVSAISVAPFRPNWGLRVHESNHPEPSRMEFFLRDNAGNEVFVLDPQVAPTHQWVHWAGTFDAVSGVAKLYRDGVEVASGVLSGPFAGMPTPPEVASLFGQPNEACPASMDGLTDELAIWDRVLAPEQINAMRVGGAGNHAPVADAGPNVTLTTAEVASSALSGTGSDADAADHLECRWSEGAATLKDWTALGADGQCPLSLNGLGLGIGQHALTLGIRDGKVSSSDDMILAIANTAPTVAAQGSGVYELGAPIALGGQVSDFDGDLIHYEYGVDGNPVCSGDIASLAGGNPITLPSCPVAGLTLGGHSATVTVSDGTNAPASAQVSLQIADNTAPTLAPTADKAILWPPNHQMIDVLIQTHADDNSGSVALSVSVASNEPQDGLGDGDLSPDWTAPVIDPAARTVALKLRSERAGNRNGRAYTVTVTATDSSGNSSSAQVLIKVPHSKAPN